MKEVVILGGHGDGLVAAQVIFDMAASGVPIRLVGFLNDHEELGSLIAGVPVLGKIQEWKNIDSNYFFHPCLLSVGKIEQRVRLIEGLEIPSDRWVSLIHPTAKFANNVKVGFACLITAYAVCQPQSCIGNFCSLRSGANIGHDVELSEFCYVGPNATVCGYGKMLKGAYLAPNAVLRDNTEMGAFSVLGAGSAAFKNLPEYSTWIGVPAKRVK